MLDDAIHPGDADGGSNPPMVVGIRQTSREMSTKIDCGAPE